MAGTIGSNSVSLSENWGDIRFYDYTFDNARMDFQDLMVAVSEKRAVAVEGEVTPMTTRIKQRNSTLDKLGNVLAELTALQAQFDSNASGSTRVGTLTVTSYNALVDIFHSLDFSDRHMTKYEVEEWIQKVKSKIDGLNNEAQTDMTRLQSLVDRRDESYSTATNLMTSISDTRGNLIRNL